MENSFRSLSNSGAQSMASDRASARRASTSSPHWYSPSRRAMRQPRRLPLSTVDTYRGRRGAQVEVSYQLYRCPLHLSSPSTVSRMWEISSTARFRGRRSRSAAAITDSRAMPMLVGEVRRARAGPGCSCQLSGGSQWSSARRNLSKYRQMRVAWWRRKARSAGGRAFP